MTVVEHQMLMYNNVLSYRTEIDFHMIPKMITAIKENISVLGLRIIDNVLLSLSNKEIEFIIPVDGIYESNHHFEFKQRFRLVNAVRARHYGSFTDIHSSLNELHSFIKENSLISITNPYVRVRNIEQGVYDIYIGVSENEL